jgi:lysophospholipase L1-like esterase
MIVYIFPALSQAGVCQSIVDAALSYPISGATSGSGRHVSPAFVTQTYCVPIKHPTLSQWAYPADSNTTPALSTPAAQAQLAAAGVASLPPPLTTGPDWNPAPPVRQPVLPPASVLDLFIDQGRTVNAGALTQWSDPNHVSNTVTVPGGSAGPTITSNAVQAFDGQRWAPTGVELSSATAQPWSHNQPHTIATVAFLSDGGVNLSTLMRIGSGAGTCPTPVWGSNFYFTDGGTSATGSTIKIFKPVVLVWQFQPGTATFGVRLNGNPIANISSGTFGDNSSAGLQIGTRDNVAGFGWTGSIEEIHGWASILSVSDLGQLEGFLATKFLIPGVQGWISDTAGYTPLGGNNVGASSPLRTAFAVTRLLTTATTIALTASNDGSDSTHEPYITVFVDGVLNSSNAVAVGGTHSFTINLDGNPHTLEIWDGELWGAGGAGTILIGIQDATGKTQLLPALVPNQRLVVWGDSISVGSLADISAHGCFQLIRQDLTTWNGRVSMLTAEGASLRGYFSIDSTFTVLAQWLLNLANEVTPGGKRLVAIAMGHNDWSVVSQWANIAAFQTSYGVLVDALHTLEATLTIIAMSPITSQNETVAGPSGFNLPAVRTAISSVAATRPWLVYVDGSQSFGGAPALGLSDLADGVHPTTAGHAKWKAWWKAVLAANGGP